MPRRLALASFLLALGSAVAAAAEPKIPDLAIESYRLPNGLKVVLHRDASVPRVAVCVAYHVGSKDERAGRTGFAHFFEHMMFRGTKNVPNYDIPLQETGAQSNAFTTEDVTVYHETVPSAYLDRALYLEAERLAFLPSALDQEKFDTEREVVKNERRQSYENVPYGLAEEAILASVFPKGHPYSWSVIGSMADLDAASLDDLRRFFLEYYHPGNATLSLAGDFNPAEAKAAIARYFGPLAPGTAPSRSAVTPTGARADRIVQGDKVSLPRVYRAWPMVAADHPDAPALDLLAEVLSGGDASRLHRAMVLDSRVAKDVSADSDTKEAGGLFTIRATAAEGKTLAEVATILDRELARLRTEPPTAAELTRALAKFEKSNYESLTSPLSRAIVLALGFLQKDDPTYYRRDIARYFKVSPADLARVAEAYLKPESVVVEVVPESPTNPKAAAVKAGPLASVGAEPALSARTPAVGPDWTKLPGPATTREFSPPRVLTRTLSNGIKVWFVPWKTLPIVTGRWIIPAGTSDDPIDRPGLTNLVSTLLPQGTKDRTATQLAEDLDELGVTYGCGTDNDDTTLQFGVLARNLEPALRLLTPMIAAPRFDPADFARERDLQVADLNQGPDRIGWIAQRAFRALLHGAEHPYGRPADGRVDSIKGTTLDEIKAFHAARFAPDRSKLLVVGDVDPEALFATLEATVGTWPKRAESAPSRQAVDAVGRDAGKRGVIYLVDKPGAVQSALRLGRVWVDRKDPKYLPAAIGNHVFGVDFLSRLNKNLRETNGFSYGARSGVDYRRSGSVWVASSSVRADATGPALREMIAEFDAIAGPRPLDEAEVALGIDALGRSFPESFEDPGSIVDVLESVALFGLPDDYLATFAAKVRSTPADAVRNVMAELATKGDRTILVVGDRKSVEPQLKALNLGEIVVIDPDGKPVGR